MLRNELLVKPCNQGTMERGGVFCAVSSKVRWSSLSRTLTVRATCDNSTHIERRDHKSSLRLCFRLFLASENTEICIDKHVACRFAWIALRSIFGSPVRRASCRRVTAEMYSSAHKVFTVVSLSVEYVEPPYEIP